MSFYLHVLESWRIFVLQTKAIKNMKTQLQEFPISELKKANTYVELDQLSEMLAECASELETEPTIGFEHFTSEKDCFAFFGADEWSERIGMLSNPQHAYHYRDILIYATQEVRAAFRPAYEQHIKTLKKSLLELANSSDYFQAVWAENKLHELATQEKAYCERYFGK